MGVGTCSGHDIHVYIYIHICISTLVTVKHENQTKKKKENKMPIVPCEHFSTVLSCACLKKVGGNFPICEAGPVLLHAV